MAFASQDYKGIVVPIISPLQQDETIDETALRKITRHLLDGGVHGIFVNSTTGEAVCLADREKQRALEIVLSEAKGKIPIYAGISETSTRRALECLRWTRQLKPDVVVAHPPYYFPPNSQDELIQYYQALAAESPLPLMIYNIPFTTKAPLALDTIRRLLEIDNVIGIKDSSVDYVLLLNLIELKRVRSDFRIFIGKSHMWAAGILSGADGGLDGISNLIPDRCVKLYQAIQRRDEQVYEMQREINEIWRVYECKSFLSGIKTALSLIGLCRPFVTHPVTPATQEERERIRQILLRYHVLIQ